MVQNSPLAAMPGLKSWIGLVPTGPWKMSNQRKPNVALKMAPVERDVLADHEPVVHVPGEVALLAGPDTLDLGDTDEAVEVGDRAALAGPGAEHVEHLGPGAERLEAARYRPRAPGAACCQGRTSRGHLRSEDADGAEAHASQQATPAHGVPVPRGDRAHGQRTAGDGRRAATAS